MRLKHLLLENERQYSYKLSESFSSDFIESFPTELHSTAEKLYKLRTVLHGVPAKFLSGIIMGMKDGEFTVNNELRGTLRELSNLRIDTPTLNTLILAGQCITKLKGDFAKTIFMKIRNTSPGLEQLDYILDEMQNGSITVEKKTNSLDTPIGVANALTKLIPNVRMFYDNAGQVLEKIVMKLNMIHFENGGFDD